MYKTGRNPKICLSQSPSHLTCLKDHTEEIHVFRIREEIKYLYKKKYTLYESLYKTHLQAALEWGESWDPIRNSIHNAINLEFEKKYKILDNKISRLVSNQKDKVDSNIEYYQRVINKTNIIFTNEQPRI